MTDIITGSGSYRTIDGRRVEIEPKNGEYWKASNLGFISSSPSNTGKRVERGQIYNSSGDVMAMRPGEENDRIVGPWIDNDSPIQEVTVRKIVAGSYRNVKVSEDGKQFGIEMGNYTADELRNAARVLNQVADFIDAS